MEKNIILCVDDERTILESLETELSIKGENWEIELAESGSEALEIAEELALDGHHLTVIISDSIMPVMKGDELLIKMHELYPLAKKILLTGQAAVGGITKAINEANLYRFIEKPWNKDDLRMTVHEAIQKFLVEKKLAEQNRLIKKLHDAVAHRNEVEEDTSIETVLYHRELFDQMFFIHYYQSLGKDIQDWLSRAAIGLICSDHHISRPEKLFFEAIIKYDPHEDRVLKYLEMIKGNIQPRLESIKVDKDTAFHLMDTLTWILVANHVIHNAEEKYLEFIGSTLGLEGSLISSFINMIKARIESDKLRLQTQQKILNSKLVPQPEVQPRTFMAKQPGDHATESSSTGTAEDHRDSANKQPVAEPDPKSSSQIRPSPHNNSVKIRNFSCYACGSEGTIQFNVLDPKSQKPETNIFGIPSYKHANKGFEFIDFNLVQLAICPTCYFVSPHKEDFRRKPNDTPTGYLEKSAFIVNWNETINNRQRRLSNFDLNQYYELKPSMELLEALYQIRIKLTEKACEMSDDIGIRWDEVIAKLTLAEILSEKQRAEEAVQLLRDCNESCRKIFESSKELSYTFKAGRMLFYLGLYFQDKTTAGEILDFLDKHVHESTRQSPNEKVLLRRIAEEVKRSFEDRDDFAREALQGLHMKSAGNEDAPKVAGIKVHIEK